MWPNDDMVDKTSGMWCSVDWTELDCCNPNTGRPKSLPLCQYESDNSLYFSSSFKFCLWDTKSINTDMPQCLHRRTSGKYLSLSF